ncbi:hypothetical protein [Mycobacterium persicum]|uniref:hypothetical protein n=1 Tax=Mycobacterium persicum TaxID=1487726 RepID=UPI0009F210BC|nr:hypothetical protein [Mycobacterium persicum]ORB34533.1 hypothetical protein BST40_25425 [Mycobacterium persicum]
MATHPADVHNERKAHQSTLDDISPTVRLPFTVCFDQSYSTLKVPSSSGVTPATGGTGLLVSGAAVMVTGSATVTVGGS